MTIKFLEFDCAPLEIGCSMVHVNLRQQHEHTEGRREQMQ